MLTLNLGSLGITEEALQRAILSELGLTPEEAVDQIADKLGVARRQDTAAAAPIRDGEKVQTDRGETVARVLSEDDVRCLNRAGDILSSIRIG